MDSNQVTEDGMPPLSERNGGDLSAQENEILPQSPIREDNQPVNEVRPYSTIPEHIVSPHVQGPTPLRERGGCQG